MFRNKRGESAFLRIGKGGLLSKAEDWRVLSTCTVKILLLNSFNLSFGEKTQFSMMKHLI